MSENVQAPLFSPAGESSSSIELPEAFADTVREPLLHEAVRMQLANRRSGTVSTKTRAFVSGGGKKPFRQKGTGRARQGSTRATQWVGGATVFGPTPRSYAYRMPRTARRAALRSALSARAATESVLVVEGFDLPSGKTRDMVAWLGKLGVESALIVSVGEHVEAQRAARNLPRVKWLRADGLNVADILRFKNIVVERAALDAISERLER